jgi:hypothetical protein
LSLDTAAGLGAAMGVTPTRRGLAYAASLGITPGGVLNQIEDANLGNRLRGINPTVMNRGGDLFGAPMPTSRRVEALRGPYARGADLPTGVKNMAEKIPGLEQLVKNDPAKALQILTKAYESTDPVARSDARQMLEHADEIVKAKRKMTYDDFTNKLNARSGVKGLSSWLTKFMLGAGARDYFGQ